VTDNAFQWARQRFPWRTSTPSNNSSLGLGPRESAPLTASWPVQPYLEGSRMWPTDWDTQADRPRYSICTIWYDTIRYGWLTCTQKLTRSPA